MGTLVLSTQYGVIIALYQSCTSDTNGQSVEKFYDFWCNWRSLKPFLYPGKTVGGEIWDWERELRAFFVLLKQTVWRLEHNV